MYKSPLLFNIYIDEVFQKCNEKCEGKGILIQDYKLKYYKLFVDNMEYLREKT